MKITLKEIINRILKLHSYFLVFTSLLKDKVARLLRSYENMCKEKCEGNVPLYSIQYPMFSIGIMKVCGGRDIDLLMRHEFLSHDPHISGHVFES